jgi:hypothetical protein
VTPPSDLYISVDVEADGPIPGPYSMLSFGMAVAGAFDGRTYRPAAIGEQTFYRELRPIGPSFEPDALAASGLDRERLRVEGADPSDAMTAASEWVGSVREHRRPVFVAYPLVYDWLFMYWYFKRFSKSGSPFGFSSAIDMKTMYAVKARVTIAKATKSQMPAEVLSSRPHTHNALDDALEQADMFNRLWAWQG